MKILIIEDDQSVAELERDYLEINGGFQCDLYTDGTQGLQAALAGDYALVIVDVMLPGLSGFEICRRLREVKDTPVIIISALADDIDKVRGLGLGADDYMTKPFEAVELVARVRALTRRQGDVVIDEVTFGDLTLDLSTHDLTNGDYTVHLSKKEFEVMQILMGSNGRIVSKQDLLTRVWSTDGETSENSVEAYISFLRKKLSHIHSVVQITTLRMLGYRLEAIHPDATR